MKHEIKLKKHSNLKSFENTQIKIFVKEMLSMLNIKEELNNLDDVSYKVSLRSIFFKNRIIALENENEFSITIDNNFVGKLIKPKYIYHDDYIVAKFEIITYDE